jgi:hypothetical protein
MSAVATSGETIDSDAYFTAALHTLGEAVPRLLRKAVRAISAGEHELCRALLAWAVRESRSSQGSVMLRRDEQIVIVAAVGHEHDLVGRTVARGSGLAWKVIELGHELHVTGVLTHDEYSATPCALLLPIRAHGAVVGTLSLNRALSFSAEDFLYAEVVALVLGRALELYRDARTATSMAQLSWRDGLAWRLVPEELRDEPALADLVSDLSVKLLRALGSHARFCNQVRRSLD